MNFTFRPLARIVWSSDRAPGPKGPPGVYVSPLTNSTPSVGTQTRIVVVAWVVFSGRTKTGRCGSASCTEPPSGNVRDGAFAGERSRRSGRSCELRLPRTSWKKPAAAWWTTIVAPSAANGRTPREWWAWWWLAVAKRIGLPGYVRRMYAISASARTSLSAASATTIPFDCSMIIELFAMPWISVLPGATVRGTIVSAGPSLGKPNWANDISHSVVRVPREARSLSNFAFTPDGKRKRAELRAGLTRTEVRDWVWIGTPSSFSDPVRGKRSRDEPRPKKRHRE